VFAVELLVTRSTRELQAYGAACLAAFVAAKKVKHSSVRELVEHLLEVLNTSDLPRWESRGGALSLPGRGDRLPGELVSVPDLADLLEAVVEIGLVDLYGADSEQPLAFALAAVEILHRNGLPAPPPQVILGEPSGEGSGWGPPLGRAIYEKARHWCLQRLEERNVPTSMRQSE
jgi:hypothetical protein